MIIDRITWTCSHDCPLRLVVLSIYMLGEISGELGDLWESVGQPRPEGFISEFRQAQFVMGNDRQGFYFSDRCFISMSEALKKGAA